jgi:hypothetical protein
MLKLCIPIHIREIKLPKLNQRKWTISLDLVNHPLFLRVHIKVNLLIPKILTINMIDIVQVDKKELRHQVLGFNTVNILFYLETINQD